MNEIDQSKNRYDNICLDILKKLPEIISLSLFDVNANLITHMGGSQNNELNLDSLIISAGIFVLSAQKIINLYNLDNLDQLLIRTGDRILLFVAAGSDRILLAQASRDIKLGLLFLDLIGTCREISKIPYEMPKRKINLENKLETLEKEFIGDYKIFISYAKNDSSYFKIKEIAENLENNNPDVKVMYFERDKIGGEDILNYMERGVQWCNVFVWFHSENSMNSKAVIDEYKMAKYLGKDIISVTEDFNSLPLSARVTWAILYENDIQKLTKKLLKDMKEYDLKNATIIQQ
ncbi:MAG: TIR domain-containing protein [Candidatus Lokiarchaeota archaeon]|nr:TIR domain-containing protein [Candidatus Lokiarchaeota archaeon]